MADIYDEQFRRRVGMHLLVCDPISRDIISAMCRYLLRAEAERDELRRRVAEAIALKDRPRTPYDETAKHPEDWQAEDAWVEGYNAALYRARLALRKESASEKLKVEQQEVISGRKKIVVKYP